MSDKIKMAFDMETSDPDDFMTLLLLLGHPRVDLQAVTVTPGTPDQVALVGMAMDQIGKYVPIGAKGISDGKSHVSDWHYKAYGKPKPRSPDAQPASLLIETCDEKTTLVTGAPLRNIGEAIRINPRWKVGRIVCQGGFAGEGVVAPEKQLPKFKGMTTCPSFNLNQDVHSAKAVIEFQGFKDKRFVSKNVCHGVYYDESLHEAVGKAKSKSKSLAFIYSGMSSYVNEKSKKLFHDPLAACCAIDHSIGEWREVWLSRNEYGKHKNEWGSVLSPGSGIWIIVDYDKEKFVSTLTETERE